MAETLSSVQPEKILKQLEKLWVEMGEAEPDKRNAVLRACSMTFLVALDEGDDAQAAGETLAELMHEHPSRAIVLRIDTRPGDTLEAAVLAQCWMPFGRRQQICCEQIEIRASASRLEEVPAIVMGMMVPDLPVVLWCRGAGLCRDERFQRLFPMIDKVIVDSAHFADAAEGIEFVKSLRGRVLTADLAWTRLTRWREMVALLFDDPRSRALLPQVERIRIRHSHGQAPPAAHYLAGWLKRTMPSPVEVSFEETDGGEQGIRGVDFSGTGVEASVVSNGSCVDLTVNSITSGVPFPKASELEMLRDELSILTRDPVFESSRL